MWAEIQLATIISNIQILLNVWAREHPTKNIYDSKRQIDNCHFSVVLQVESFPGDESTWMQIHSQGQLLKIL